VSLQAHDARVLIVSGNRGGKDDWFQQLQQAGKVPLECSFWELYNSVFNALFQPRPTFFSMGITFQVGSVMLPVQEFHTSLAEAIAVLNQPDTFSLGIHIRAGDAVVSQESQSDAFCGQAEPPRPHVRCVMKLTERPMYKKAKTRVLVIFSDSRCVKKHLLEYFQQSDAFTQVWSQTLTGGVNIDTTLSSEDEAAHAFRQSMRDWNLLRHMDILATATSYNFFSGFPASALVTTSVDKELYELGSCQRAEKDWLCASRFC